MTVQQLIKVLEKLDPELPVCGENETCTWDIDEEDIYPVLDVYTGTKRQQALVLGYKHHNYKKA